MPSPSTNAGRPILTATWTNLALLTYAVDPDRLQPLLPPGCRADVIDGQAFVSLVAFDFLNTRVLGLRWPGFVNFPEINLRYYVRYKDDTGDHRGVAFVREFVPQRLVAAVARWFYNEPYQGVEMTSRTVSDGAQFTIEHNLKLEGQTHQLRVRASSETTTPSDDSIEHFFKEHKWGFGTSRSGKLIRYQVVHPVWQVHAVQSYEVKWNFAAAYGEQWAFLQKAEPMSVLLAAGSPVSVFPRGRLYPSNYADKQTNLRPETT